jgi:hypothetical protein
MDSGPPVDYYEALQISVNAEPETVHASTGYLPSASIRTTRKRAVKAVSVLSPKRTAF